MLHGYWVFGLLGFRVLAEPRMWGTRLETRLRVPRIKQRGMCYILRGNINLSSLNLGSIARQTL